MEKRIEENIPILGQVHVNFLNLSSRIYNSYISIGEVERQKKSPHLGLISRAFLGISHSRYDYLILQCVISEIVDNSFRGTTSAQGSIKINGNEYLGNDIIKSWILLSNFGHCMNTIGDEKALLLKAIQEKRFKTFIINGLKDEKLKAWGQTVINNFDYVSFHHLLSIRRIYKSNKRRVDFQNEVLDVYKLFLLDTEMTSSIANPQKVEQLKLIYSNIRNLSIVALDSRNSSLPISIDILSTVLSFDFFESRYQETKASDIFFPLISLLCDKLYLHPKSQTRQRAYEIGAMEEMSKKPYNSIIEVAITNGLYNPDICDLKHFLRIQLHSDNLRGDNLRETLRNVLTVKKGIANVEASLDFNPFTDNRVIDFYVNHKFFDIRHLPAFLSNITRLMTNQIKGTVMNYFSNNSVVQVGLEKAMTELKLKAEDSEKLQNTVIDELFSEAWEKVQSENIPPFKEILWAILRFHIKEQFYFDIDHHTSKSYRYFGVKLNESMDYLSGNIEKAINEASNPDRKHELLQLKKGATRKFVGATIACLERVTIYDYSKAPGQRIVTDIDSIVLKFNDTDMYLELNEAKNTRKPFNDAKKDLLKKLRPVLNSNCKGNTIRKVKGFGAKLVIKH